MLFRTLLLLAASFCAATTFSQSNFDNGMPVTFLSGFPATIGSDGNLPLHIADDFVLPGSASTISRIVWHGTQGNRVGDPIPSREFNIEIYGPGVVPSTPHPIALHTFHNVMPSTTRLGKRASPRTIGPFVINRYSFQLPSTITLTAGQTYWICIYAAPDPSVSPVNEFYWSHSTYTGGNTNMRVPPPLPFFVPTLTYLSYHRGDVSFKLYP
ncbi:MAG: hypothetical protein AAFX06_26090 [Planctomycetota bacterium]